MARDVIKKKKPTSTDARTTRRYPVRGRFSGASKTAIRGDLHDVSPTGLCLSTTSDVERGKVLHLEFELPTGPVELVAEVRWRTEREAGQFELGLRIVRIAEAFLQAIREATTERNRTPPGAGPIHRRPALPPRGVAALREPRLRARPGPTEEGARCVQGRR